jgi:hypothetical protein
MAEKEGFQAQTQENVEKDALAAKEIADSYGVASQIKDARQCTLSVHDQERWKI